MDRSLYEDDIYAWSEQQAAALRRLAADPGRLPNQLDLVHVIEEIEDVRHAQRNAVESLATRIYVHLLKLAAQPESQPAKHWRAEIAALHNDLSSRVTAAMRHRIDVDELWTRALRQAQARLEAAECPRDLTERTISAATVAGPPLNLDVVSKTNSTSTPFCPVGRCRAETGIELGHDERK